MRLHGRGSVSVLWWAVSLGAVAGCRTPAAPTAPCECREAAAPAPAPASADRDEDALRRVIAGRRSIRTYTDAPVARDDVAAVLWAAQGVTLSSEEADRVDGQGLRAAPSAGATFPLETYLLANRVDGLDPGLYHYRPADDGLEPAAGGAAGDLARLVADACGGQRVVADAAAVVVFAAVLARTAERYGDRAERYVMMELGHANQNAHLMASARGLGACAIGAFDEAALAQVLELPPEHRPFYLLTLGRPRTQSEAR